jgi:DNA-binding response OmpR family regulator
MGPINSVLCLDDNDDSLELLKIFFEFEDCKVVTCTTYEECFNHIKTNNFSAIVLDGWLVDKDGFEICSEIRADDEKIPIVFFSADDTESSREKGLEAGADAYLIKPDDLDNVVPTVMQLIEESD